MAQRSGPYSELRASATFAANDTWCECTNTIVLGAQADSLRLYVTVGTASAGNVDFYVQHSTDNSTWFDYSIDDTAPKIWGSLVFSAVGTKSIELSGLNLYPGEIVKIFFRASAGAASAVVGIDGIAFKSSGGGGGSGGGATAGDAPSGEPDDGNPVKIGFHARSTQLTAVDNDDRVDGVANLNGEQVLAGYDWTASSHAVYESDPLDQRFSNQSLVDTTNVSAATHYYPDSDGFSMDGYADLSLSGKLIDADGTLTLTFEATNDEDTSGGDWVQVYFRDDKNDSTVNSYSVTNGTLTMAASLNNNNFRYGRWKLVASGATNTVILKQRRKAL